MGEESTQSFSHILRHCRLAAGLTQEALAERAGVSVRSIQAIERNESRPQKDTARLLVAGLSLNAEEQERFLAAATPAPRRRSAARQDGSDQAPTGDRSAFGAGAVSALPHNLPAALATLIGREREQTRVRELLEEARLVTLTGSGGVGKTRLALAVAEQLTSTYLDGVWLVQLASVSDPTLVLSSVARAFGLREDSERSPLHMLTDVLRGKQALVILDDCEHLVASCNALVTTLLQSCPALRILATSQVPLGVAGERRYRVPSLAVPDAQRRQSHDKLLDYESVRLFVARAQERRDDFALTAANAWAVAEICARLDGIPLAIELAAARAVSLPVETIAARLDARFALLTTGARTALPRQQTLRATFDWSCELLSEPEQKLLYRLAVFAGGAGLGAAEDVCADPQNRETFDAGAAMIETQGVVDLLDTLVQRSLVQAEQGRYVLMETIRAYAYERLVRQGQEAAIRRRHACFFLQLAEDISATLTGPEQAQGLARLASEHDNLRAALRWAQVCRDGPLALQLAAALWRFWYLRSYLGEGRSWLEAALALPDGDERHAGGATRATACHGVAVLAWTQGDYAHAVLRAEQALTLWRTLGDRAGSARALNLLGLVAIDQQDWELAARALEESLALRRDLQDRWGIGTSLHNLGTVACGRGDYDRASALYAESLALRVALADQAGIAISYRDQGALAMARGDAARAQELYRQSLPYADALGDLVGVAQGLEGLAAVSGRQAHAEPAAQLLSAAAVLREQVGAPVALRDRAAVERLLSSLRTALGAAFAQAYAAGRDAPWEELVASFFGGTEG